MKFNIDDYKGKYAMHCKTKEEVESFRKYLSSVFADKENFPRECYMTETPWEKYKEKTAFKLNGFGYGSVDEYKSLNYTVLEWSDYVEDTVCEKRIDREYLNKVFDLFGIEPYEEFTILNEDFLGRRFGIYLDLTVYENIRDSFEKEMPLVESNRIIVDILRKNLTIQKVPEISEKEQLAIDYARALGCKWIAKHYDGWIAGFTEKPHKSIKIWNTKNGKIYPINIPISFIHWDDEEPYYIGD